MHQCIYCSSVTSNPLYCSRTCAYTHKTEAARLSLQVEASNFETTGYPLKIECRRIKKLVELIKGPTCSLCGIDQWLDKPLIKILDHIDGNSDNWHLSNLRLICSNCDSQLPTYKSRNIGKGRHSRRIRYSRKQSY